LPLLGEILCHREDVRLVGHLEHHPAAEHLYGLAVLSSQGRLETEHLPIAHEPGDDGLTSGRVVPDALGDDAGPHQLVAGIAERVGQGLVDLEELSPEGRDAHARRARAKRGGEQLGRLLALGDVDHHSEHVRNAAELDLLEREDQLAWTSRVANSYSSPSTRPVRRKALHEVRGVRPEGVGRLADELLGRNSDEPGKTLR